MRKLLIIVFVAGLLASCHIFNGHTAVVNNSTRPVSFVWGGHAETLERGESASIGFSFAQITEVHPFHRVYLNYIGSGNFEFINRQRYEVRIIFYPPNLEGTLSAGAWMDPVDLNFPPEQPVWVYTSRPRFTAISTDGFPLPVLYVRRDDGSFDVAIGWN